MVAASEFAVDLRQGMGRRWREVHGNNKGRKLMTDLLMIALLAAAFVVAGAYIWACDHVATPPE